MQLITYVDRLGGDLAGLRRLLQTEFDGLFSGVHILPFFDPIDGADAGFDPVDHTRVDARLGDWDDVAALCAEFSVMADLIVNHVSAESPQFSDVRRHGESSKFWDLFLRKTDLFPASEPEADTAAAIGRIYRPRPGLPFSTIRLDDGTACEFWTTFTDKQLDINVETAAGRAYLESILDVFSRAGIREIRLDAAGYAIKRRNTSCFMLPETYEFIGALSEQAAKRGMDALVEIHSHYDTQVSIAARVGRVYDFALPPLVLHALYSSDAEPLKRWLEIAPRNCVTVLDTHDGIGVVDVARHGDTDGLLSDAQVDALVNTIHEKTAGQSQLASGHAASNLDVYQVNSTYYDALGRDDIAYLVARAIQFFVPGTPQVYYVGLLAGHNDMDLVEQTGVGRDINRHYYSRDEIRAALRRPVVAELFKLIRIRNKLTALGGEFSIAACPADELVLRWDNGDTFAQLHVELAEPRAVIDYAGPEGSGTYRIDDNTVAGSA